MPSRQPERPFDPMEQVPRDIPPLPAKRFAPCDHPEKVRYWSDMKLVILMLIHLFYVPRVDLK